MEDGTALTVDSYDGLMDLLGMKAEQVTELLAGINGQLQARARRVGRVVT